MYRGVSKVLVQLLDGLVGSDFLLFSIKLLPQTQIILIRPGFSFSIEVRGSIRASGHLGAHLLQGPLF